MMQAFFERSYSQAYKSVKLLFKNGFRWFDITLWPLILLFSITFFVSFLESDARILSMVVLGIMGWRAVYHIQMEIASNYMEEYWSNSLTHLFITPVRIVELVFGGLLSGALKFFMVFTMYYIVAWWFYGFAITNWPVVLFAFFFLMVFGIALGMITLGLMFLFSSNAFSLSFTVPDIFVLISGVYYPVSVLPGPVQAFALLLPSAHAFNLLKSTLGFAEYDLLALVVSSIVWLIASYLFVSMAFRHAKKTGKLVRVA
ncbi:MAG: ABC transporter permease [Candidatus Diapherotrites archaeon]|nr:ABC transporter permease [Candidatus Diapherotrites archaeon]